MLRRQFLNLTALAGLVAVTPISLQAIDFRQTKPNTWTSHSVDEAIKALYGDISVIESGVLINTPKVASSAKAIPVNVSSQIDAKSVAIFQDANPEATIAVFTMGEGAILDYDIKIKMAKSGVITAIVEGKDGKFYRGQRALEVALNDGCDGS